jgi:ParB-like chromosome segregation protein Spo0J
MYDIKIFNLQEVNMINWHLEVLPIKSLEEHPKNPRQISKKKFHRLSKLISKFGLIDKPIVNLDKTIIGEHQRIRVLKKMKLKEVECWVPDTQIEDFDMDELCIGLNLFLGDFDYDILADLWEPIDLLKHGFTEEQLVGKYKEAEDSIFAEPKEEKKKKMKCCPNCGHEF